MELTRINNRMKSILLNDEEWAFFIDALQLTEQSDIEYQGTETDSAEGFRLDSIKSLLFSNNATSFLDLMTVLNMYGLRQRQLQISPGDAAEYTYNVFFYKGEASGKTIYMCPMQLLSESIVEEATQSTPAKVNGDYIVAAAGIEIIGQPIPIKGYRNGVVEFDQSNFPSISDFVIRVTIKRVIHNYRKGAFYKTPLGQEDIVDVAKRALPLVSHNQTWLFSVLIGGTQELPWNSESSPLLVTLQGNDHYSASLVNVSTLSGDGISLPDAVGGVVSGTAPGVLRIAYGTNQASTVNTAVLVIETDHCGTFTYNLVQLAAGFELTLVNYQEGQTLNWFNIPLAYSNPSYGQSFISRFPYRYGTTILESGFPKPLFRLSPYSPYTVRFFVDPTGTDAEEQVTDGNFKQFPIDSPSGNVGMTSPSWWQLYENPQTHNLAVVQWLIKAITTPDNTQDVLETSFKLNVAWFFMAAFDLTATIYMLSCNGDARKSIDFYTNISEFWFSRRHYGLADRTWFVEDASLNPPYYTGVAGHFENDLVAAEVTPRETQEKRTNFIITLPDRTYYIPVVRPVPRATRFDGEVSSATSFIAGIDTNFVNTKVWVVANVIATYQGTREHYYPLFRLTYVGSDVDDLIQNGAVIAGLISRLDNGIHTGWAPSYGQSYGDFDYFINTIVPILRRDVISDWDHLSVVLYYTEDTGMPDGDGFLQSNIQGFTEGELKISV